MIETLGSLIADAGIELPPIPQRLASLPPAHDDWWYGEAVHSGVTGLRVSGDGAMRCVPYWACVRVIAETVATLPFNVYKRLARGKEVAAGHEVHHVIHDAPNLEVTAVEFWETSLAHILTAGNSYARVIVDTANRVTELQMLDPRRMTVARDRETGVKFFEYASENGKIERYFDYEILHIPGLGYDGLIGYSPVQQHRRTIELSMAQEEYKLRYLSNNARPGMYIKHPGTLSDNASKRIRESWSNIHAGLQNAGKPGVLEEGMTIETVGPAAKDMEFIAQEKFSVEQIARIFRVPLHLIQSLDRATFSNIEHQSIDFVVHTIRPWCRRIEARVNRTLFGPRESAVYFAEFNIEGLLRGDSDGRSKFYATMRNAGILTANEIREKENYNAHPDGDELLVQGAMVPASQAGQQQQAEPQTANDDELAAARAEAARLDAELADMRELDAILGGQVKP